MDAAMQAALKAADNCMLIGSIFSVVGVGLGTWMNLRHRKDQQGGR